MELKSKQLVAVASMALMQSLGSMQPEYFDRTRGYANSYDNGGKYKHAKRKARKAQRQARKRNR